MYTKLIGGLMENKTNNHKMRFTFAIEYFLYEITQSRFVEIQYSFIFSALLLWDKDYYKVNWIDWWRLQFIRVFIFSETCATQLKLSFTHKPILSIFNMFVCLFAISCSFCSVYAIVPVNIVWNMVSCADTVSCLPSSCNNFNAIIFHFRGIDKMQ